MVDEDGVTPTYIDARLLSWLQLGWISSLLTITTSSSRLAGSEFRRKLFRLSECDFQSASRLRKQTRSDQFGGEGGAGFRLTPMTTPTNRLQHCTFTNS